MTIKPQYSFDGDQVFVIDQYNDAAPFASFLPGIAGVTGIPAWVFYVNRGQAIASFGVRNKDGAMLEFFPADKAYQLTASRGFRTFLKISDGVNIVTHEPFQRGAGQGVRQRLYVSPHEMGVEEIHPSLGLAIRADLFTLPEASLAGLVRRVTVQNISQQSKTVEIVDGLPQVLPYGLNQWCVKFMSRTVEAYMVVEGVLDNCPYFRLKVLPTDTPLVEPVVAGNFFVGFLNGQRNPVLVDAEKIFGMAGDFSHPERFYASEPLDFGKQVSGNRTPSTFQALKLELGPGESQVFYGLYGHVSSWSLLQAFLEGIPNGQYFEDKREENRRLVEGITRRAYTATAYPLFDAYAKQCYLDNGMRGGFSMKVPGGKHLYLFGRKHGDLERDYNDFLLQDSPFSEGNGDFRDVLQNRRMDLFFDPELDAKNIHYFFNLIQPDGYNPTALRNTRFVVEASAFSHYTGRFAGLDAVLSRPFKYAELWLVLQANSKSPLTPFLQRGGPENSFSESVLINPAEDIEAVITDLLQDAQEIEDVEFDRGYWSDHWTYLLDLLEGYAAIFPDRIATLFHEKCYTFYDTDHFVLPRSGKYVVTSKGIRQYGAVEERKEKWALIESRFHSKHHARYQGGKGEVVVTTLLGKILTLVVNKLASLDPYGVGIEMEADRPGWCDAMNGLPGLLGSSVNETIELKRLADFTLGHLGGIEGNAVELSTLTNQIVGRQPFAAETNRVPSRHRDADLLLNSTALALSLPIELANFIDGLENLLILNLSDQEFWRDSHDLKEAYRERVFMGFQGEEGTITFATVRNFLKRCSNYLDMAIAKAKTAEGIITYFAYQAEEYSEIDGRVDVTRFRQRSLPLFLEGFVHALRIAKSGEALRLYQAVCASELFDEILGMFRVNVPLGKNAMEFGRIGIFNYGWLENGSVFLHMHYKFVLEMVRQGLIQEFYSQMDKFLVPFRDPAEYRRNPIENVSFIVGSGFAIDPREQGRGCVARLSGATVEFLHLWTYLFLGAKPFLFENGRLLFRPSPNLSKVLFSTKEKRAMPFGEEVEILPCDSAACSLLGGTLLVYINPQRRDTFGAEAVLPQRYKLHRRDGSILTVEGTDLEGATAEALRLGHFRRVDVILQCL